MADRSGTSEEAYREIRENGLLSEMRLRAYEVLFKHGPGTSNELAQHLPLGPQAHGERSNIHARLNELVERGVAQVLGTRPCNVTGHRVLVYDIVDGALPRVPKKGATPSPCKIATDTLARVKDIVDAEPCGCSCNCLGDCHEDDCPLFHEDLCLRCRIMGVM